ncbi:MAG: ribosomal protein L3 N(5)-glutamine methyltransferase [Betaproteobacteria bacterium RIFCSPLOWO2_12_FULL_65_14]|nr:MAG: ribosomal protein L3 N(5)-glutamine methyltransferase [Betaproteobacteria bacterium RIFCSPLOWO2_12_FULL_65_14]
MRLGELIRRTERRLQAARLHYGHGTDNPRDEAAFLVLRGLGLPFDADLGRAADPAKVEALIATRIAKRIPAAYLLHEAWLAGLPFYVDRRVIVPRSHIAELLREHPKPWLRRSPRRVLDLCTGSGCLAILAARAFPRAAVDASDISAAALAVARRNVERYDLEEKVRLIRSDLFARLPEKRYDLILSNPPYVTSAAMRRLPAEYRYEPGMALAAGRDGLELVRRILAGAPAHLSPGGLLVCEVGDGRRAVERAFPGMPFLWPQDEVFIAERASMAAGSRMRSRRGSARG